VIVFSGDIKFGNEFTNPALHPNVPKNITNWDNVKFQVGNGGSSGKCVLSGATDKNIINFMQRHNFRLEEFDISETISHFVQRFDLVVSAFQQSG